MRILQGDILSFQGDTIVNPANLFLRHGAGLASIIASAATSPVSAAGEGFKMDCHRQPTIATGDACWTRAGNLPFKGIVHAVGPVWSGGDFMERDLLEIAHDRAIEVAVEHGCSSIAFPAISCGLFRFPVSQAAEIAVQVAAWSDLDVSFYLFEDDHFKWYCSAAQAAGITFDTTPLSR